MTNLETPLGYLHEITEPEWGDGPTRMYSASADNPWSHWTEHHKAKCQYKCTPLYARPVVEPPAEPAKHDYGQKRHWEFHQDCQCSQCRFAYKLIQEAQESQVNREAEGSK